MTDQPATELVTTPGCGENGWWCHRTCGRHGTCQYVKQVSVTSVPLSGKERQAVDGTVSEHFDERYGPAEQQVLQEVWIDPKTDEPVFGPWMGDTVPDQPAEQDEPTADDYIHAAEEPTELLTCPNPDCGSDNITSAGIRGVDATRITEHKCHQCGLRAHVSLWYSLSRMRQERDELKGLLVERHRSHLDNLRAIGGDRDTWNAAEKRMLEARNAFVAKARQLAEEQDDE